MRSAQSFSEIYLYFEFVDMRKSINGLSSIAQLEASADWKKDQLFVFVNKSRKLMKVLYFDKTGFALWSKRLEEDKFPWKKFFKEKVSVVTSEDLDFILSGVNIFSKHEEKFYETVV
jgi:transposase